MLYENVLSVAFIYALGVKRGVGAKPDDVIADSINFYQQTPADGPIGDLLAHWNGKFFITEFKRSFKQLRTEISKHAKEGLVSYLQSRELEEFSRAGHYIGYGSYHPSDVSNRVDLIFEEYLSVLYEEPSGEQVSFNSFIETLKGDVRRGLDFRAITTYVSALKEFHLSTRDNETGTNSEGRLGSPEGVATFINTDGFAVAFTYRSYDELELLLTNRIQLTEYIREHQDYKKSLSTSLKDKMPRLKNRH